MRKLTCYEFRLQVNSLKQCVMSCGGEVGGRQRYKTGVNSPHQNRSETNSVFFVSLFQVK